MPRQPMRILKSVARASLARAADYPPLRGRILFRLPPVQRGVALTFDDGPHPDHTPHLLDLLAAHGARATFFLVGERANRHPRLVRRIAAAGHTIGNHSYTHPDCRLLSDSAFREELERTDQVIREAGVDAPVLPFRPPGGRLAPRQLYQLGATGRPVILWSVNPYDFCSSEEAILGECAKAAARDVIILHDGYEPTTAALPRLLDQLASRNLQPVGLST